MATMTRVHMLTVATLVTAAILGGTYALGHSLGRPDGPLAPPDARAHHQDDTSPEAESDGQAEDRAGASSPAAPQSPRQPPTPSASPIGPGLPARPSTTPQPGPPGPGSGGPDWNAADWPPQLPLERGGPSGARLTTGAQYVALTFDDGPDPRYTPQTLSVLRDYHVKATFCLVGQNARAYPELVRAIAAEGHTLCNHSWAHDVGLGSLRPATILADLIRTNEAIRAALPGTRIAYFRQPGGNWTPSVVAAARQLGMTSLHWTVDPQDWTRPGAGKIATRVTAGITPGAIVLLHDAGGNRQGTVNALAWILPDLGRRFALAALPTGPPAAISPTGGTPPIAPGQPDARSSGVPPVTAPPPGAVPTAPPGTPARRPVRF